MKIKDRITKKKLMTSIYEYKKTLSNVNGMLRKAIFEGGGNLSNSVIA
jgi:hypothetical protein